MLPIWLAIVLLCCPGLLALLVGLVAHRSEWAWDCFGGGLVLFGCIWCGVTLALSPLMALG